MTCADPWFYQVDIPVPTMDLSADRTWDQWNGFATVPVAGRWSGPGRFMRILGRKPASLTGYKLDGIRIYKKG